MVGVCGEDMRSIPNLRKAKSTLFWQHLAHHKNRMKNKKSRITEEEREAYRLVGRRGGRATAKKGKKYMSMIGKAGAKKRWATDDE